MFKKALLFVFVLAHSGAIYAVETVDIAEARSKLHALCDEGKYEAALPVAERIIDELSAKFGEDSGILTVSYHNKAIIERALGDFSRAEVSFEESIRIVRVNNGNYSLSLAEVLIEFGTMHYELEQYDLALEKFREAQHIAQRNDGVFTLKQIDAMGWISAAVKQGQDPLLMDTQEKFYFRIYKENYLPGDIRLLPAMERLGGWFKESGQFKSAIKTYQQSLELIDAFGEDDEYRKIPILREMSSVAYLSNRCCRNKPLEQVLDIMQGGSGYGDVEELIKATLHLADMKMLSKESPEAGELYKKAWDLRSGTPGRDDRAQIEFGQAMPLGYGNVVDGIVVYDEIVRGGRAPMGMKTYRPRREDRGGFGTSMSFTPERPRQKLIGAPVLMCFQQVQEFLPPESGNKMGSYYVELGFSVRQNGSVGRVEIKDSNTPGRLTRYVKKILKSLRYRPKIENGAAVPSEVVVRQTFNDVDALALQKMDMFPERLSGAMHVCKLLTALR